MSFYSAHRWSDISVHTSPPRAVSCCLNVSSSCSLTSSCWLFLSRSVSRERILCNQHHIPRRNYKASKAQSDRLRVLKATQKIFNTTDRTGPPFLPPAACFCRSWAAWRAAWSLHQSFSWGERSPVWVSPALPRPWRQSCWIWSPAWWRGSL